MADDKTAPTPTTETNGPEYWTDGKAYFVPESKGPNWCRLNAELFKVYLASPLGGDFRSYADKVAGERMSPRDAEYLRVSIECRVEYAGPLAGVSAGIKYSEGKRILVTEDPRRLDPVPGQYPTIDRFLRCMFQHTPEDELDLPCDQLPYFEGWLAHTLRAYYRGKPVYGACLALAGDAGTGKTLGLKAILKEMLGGSEAKPFAFISGRDNFNGEMVKSVLWSIDDEQSDWSIAKRQEIGAHIKQITANDGLRFRDMHKTALVLHPLSRLVILLNMEPDNLQVLPPMSADIEGKLMLLKAYSPPDSPLNQTRSDGQRMIQTNREFEEWQDKLLAEVPQYIHHLLNADHPTWRGRYGVEVYHHPEINSAQFEVSLEANVLRCLDVFYFETPALLDENSVMVAREDGPFEKSSREMWEELMAEGNGLPQFLQVKLGKLRTDVVFARKLAQLERVEPGRIRLHRRKTGNKWIVSPEPAA